MRRTTFAPHAMRPAASAETTSLRFGGEVRQPLGLDDRPTEGAVVGAWPAEWRSGRPDSTREFIGTLTGVLIVLVVFYAGLLLFFMTGPSTDDIDSLRKLARWVLVLAVVASGLVIFLGSSMFGIGSAEEVMDEEEVLLEEYLGLGDEEARQDAEEGATVDEEDTEEGHA